MPFPPGILHSFMMLGYSPHEYCFKCPSLQSQKPCPWCCSLLKFFKHRNKFCLTLINLRTDDKVCFSELASTPHNISTVIRHSPPQNLFLQPPKTTRRRRHKRQMPMHNRRMPRRYILSKKGSQEEVLPGLNGNLDSLW